jgi:hypothetical protein
MNPICGIDIAKDEIVTTILADNFKETRKFGVHLDDLFELKKWLKDNNCIKTVMESVRPDRVRCEATKVLPRKITRETI